MARYNPEKRAWRGKSHKKGRKLIRDLREGVEPDPFSQAVWDRLERAEGAINETWGDARYATVAAKYDVETGNLVYVDDTVTCGEVWGRRLEFAKNLGRGGI